MTDEQIIEMAKQAGFEDYGTSWIDSRLTTFARIIQAAQREEDARICDDLKNFFGYQCASAIRNQGK